MNALKFKILVLSICLIVLAISLTQVAFIYEGAESVVVDKGWTLFLMGSVVVLGGATLEWLIWCSNPLALVAIIFLIKNNKVAVKLSFAAFLIALSFSTWQEIMKLESGAMGKIISLGLGYYLWLSSMLILFVGTFFYFKKYPQTPKMSDFEKWEQATFK